MHRLLVSLIAVAALATGEGRAQPRPVWSVDLVEKKAEQSSVLHIGFAPDGRTLLALTFNPRPGRPDRVDGLLCGVDTVDHRELYRVRVGNLVPPWTLDPPFAFIEGNRVLVAAPGELAVRGYRDGRVVAAHRGLQSNCLGVWAVDDRSYFLLDYFGLTGKLSRGRLPDGPDDPVGWKEVGPVFLLPPQPLLPPKVPHRFLAEAAVSRDGRQVAAYESDRPTEKPALVLYQVKPGDDLELQPIARAESPHTTRLLRLKFSPDGRVLASGGLDCELKLWSTSPGREWKVHAAVAGSGGSVSDIAFRSDGKLLAFTTLDKEPHRPNVRLVDVADGRVVGSFRSADVAQAVAFSRDGKIMATGSSSGRVEFWNVDQLLAAPKP